jgi:putative membrane protein
MGSRAWFMVLFLALIVFIPLVNDVVSKYQEISGFSSLLGIVFLASILGLIFLVVISVYRYVKGIVSLESSERLKYELMEAIRKEDKSLVREKITDFFNFCENFYDKRYEIYSLRKEWESETKKHDLSIDEMLEKLHRLEKRVLLSRDKEAEKAIRNIAVQTAISTAISPIALVDALIMFWKSWFLVRETSKIYGFRPNFVNTVKLFRKSVQNMTISASAELADDLIIEILGLESLVLEKLSKALSQAFLNGILILRFGYNVIEICRPLPLDKKEKQDLFRDSYSWFCKEFFTRVVNNTKEKLKELAEKFLPEPINEFIGVLKSSNKK